MKIFSLYILLSTILVSQLAFSQNNLIHGQLTDTIKEEVIIGANVVLQNANYYLGTNTDSVGEFLLKDIPDGVYVLSISHPGYSRKIFDSIQLYKSTLLGFNVEYPEACKYDKENNYCPICKKVNKVIPIVYGFPSHKMARSAKKGKIRLGGCSYSGCEPNWYCNRDKLEF